MKFSAFNSPEDSTEQLIQLAPSKATRINMATAFLMSKKQWRPQSIWSAISELNCVITHPESGNMFYQIIARYFEKFRDIAPVEVGNVYKSRNSELFTGAPKLDTGKKVRSSKCQ